MNHVSNRIVTFYASFVRILVLVVASLTGGHDLVKFPSYFMLGVFRLALFDLPLLFETFFSGNMFPHFSLSFLFPFFFLSLFFLSSFLFRFLSASMYLGCWRTFVVPIIVSSTIVYHGLAYSLYSIEMCLCVVSL